MKCIIAVLGLICLPFVTAGAKAQLEPMGIVIAEGVPTLKPDPETIMDIDLFDIQYRYSGVLAPNMMGVVGVWAQIKFMRPDFSTKEVEMLCSFKAFYNGVGDTEPRHGRYEASVGITALANGARYVYCPDASIATITIVGKLGVVFYGSMAVSSVIFGLPHVRHWTP